MVTIWSYLVMLGKLPSHCFSLARLDLGEEAVGQSAVSRARRINHAVSSSCGMRGVYGEAQRYHRRGIAPSKRRPTRDLVCSLILCHTLWPSRHSCARLERPASYRWYQSHRRQHEEKIRRPVAPGRGDPESVDPEAGPLGKQRRHWLS